MRIELNREPRKLEIREVRNIASGEPFLLEHVFEPEKWALLVSERIGRALIARSFYGGAKGMRLCCGTVMSVKR